MINTLAGLTQCELGLAPALRHPAKGQAVIDNGWMEVLCLVDIKDIQPLEQRNKVEHWQGVP